MKKLCLLLLLVASGCVAPKVDDVPSKETLSLVWPSPPNPVRISFTGTFASQADLGYQESLFARMGNAMAGESQKRLVRPYAIAINARYIAVADPGSGLTHIYDKKRKSYRPIAKVGKFELESPISVAIGKDKLYLADSVLGKVFILDDNFKLIHEVNDFERPTSVAVEPVSERLYVADTLAHKIIVLGLDGKFLNHIGERGDQNGQFNFPSHITVAKERLYVNDTMNFRIQVFDLEGNHLTSFGEHGVGPGYFSQPKGIAVDSDSNIYVADALTNKIQIFNLDGEFLLEFGKSGNWPGEFSLPSGVTIYNDRIFVADSLNRRVQEFQYLKGAD